MKIGIFGGSFNPIHNGHAIIASYLMQHGIVDQLWFMVSPQNPLKQAHEMADEMHRLRMTEMVSRRITGASTSAFEFQLPRPSYTIDTLMALKQKFPDDDFYLIIGADNWDVWDHWRAHDEIVKQFHVLVYPRLGYNVDIPDSMAERVQAIPAPVVEISSTQVRQMTEAGQDIAFYVPDDVVSYIQKHKLYTHS